MSKLDDIIRKVQGLIAKADHPNTPPAEADTARNMAEALMFKYRIEEIAERGGPESLAPTWKEIWVVRYRSEFRHQYTSILGSIVNHFECKSATQWKDRDGEDWLMASVCGYESDLRFIESLFTSAALSFGKRLEPKYDPELSDQVNAYLMRSAGMEGRRIAEAIYGRDDKSLRPKVRAMFKKEAEARGENPSVLLGKGNSVKVFRESYAEGFVSELWNRLYNMRQSRARHDGSLVLAGRSEAIIEAFYERFPSLRPKDVPAIGTGQSTCKKCEKAKSGYCREHAWLRPRKQREKSVNYSGIRRGREAARTVDLGITGREIK